MNNLRARLPAFHPLRQELNDEVHSRPPEAMWPQERVFHVALVCNAEQKLQLSDHLKNLAIDYQVPPDEQPRWDAPQVSVTLSKGESALRMRVERHTEFVSFYLFERADTAIAFDRSAAKRLPPGWLNAMPGTLLVAIDLFMKKSTAAHDAASVAGYFDGNTLIGGTMADGAGQVFTDFVITDRGTTRMLVCNQGMGSRQAGRIIQRLIELETYRMAALLSFPVARDTLPKLSSAEQALVEMTREIASQSESADALSAKDGLETDRRLLGRLTDLAADVENISNQTRVRFTAAEAYFDLVQKRIEELKELRTSGMQSLGEFMTRRLGPAMKTCAWTARRQQELSERISRATQLLRTRVEIEREAQNQALLESMDSRAKLQLRLQETVEGLSIVAITYYSVSLIGYIAKALKATGLHVDPELCIGIGIPVVAGAAYWSMKAMRKRLGLH